ncbi:MAG TPA: sigma-70 family RNA polymerase sigma factor [Saprospiraceae bacterium]|nr:sigma-70 family RNA polymerase sigma factor [Saprospiraceae bacterium]MCB9327837.1 sigma-70 family RNA polymerase sigma factor [Lewinellaceae bacterium]HPK09473.1 sigma-70 family RNA polymerase sigma factor [Saprospiraceae bacterium]HRX27824.1 sigma-70 family RNA polymerase sigma factor [Saprospiraceae bacterium]
MVNSSSVYELIQECLANNRTAQRQLFEIYAPKMIIVCRRYVRLDTEAEDVMQEAFVKIFRNLKSFNFEGSFEGWVRKIMINTSLKYISKKHFQNESTTLSEVNEESVEPEILYKLNEEDIMDLIRSLPDGYRHVFNMYIIEGYSHKEIASMLGIEESTSRSQLVKARRILQDKIINLQKIAI